jgi:predicted permease
VLLIACANVASLLVSRTLSRRGELAIRVSLGATTRAIVRQLMVEAMLLALAGGALGVLLAPAGARLLAGLVPAGLPVVEPSIDPRLVATAVGLAIATGILFSAVPALQAARATVGDALRQAGRAGVGARSRVSRDVLVVVQVSAAVVLLVGAGLLIRTFDNLRQLELGFRPDRIVTMRTPLPSPKYADPDRRLAFYERVAEAVQRLPGVQNAAYVSTLPFASQGNTIYYEIEGQPAEGFRDTLYRVGTNQYLETIGARLVEGRLPGVRDGRDTPLVLVINESFAALHFQGRSPLGARVRFGNAAAPWRTIVGVVRDVRERGYRFEAKPAAYVLYSQVLTSWYPENLVVRAEADPMALMPSIRRVIADADPEQPIAGVRLLQGLIDLDVADRRDQTTLLGVFAGLALLLAALGLYGVLAHAVTQRRREIALRMALGASLASVVRSVAVRGQLLVAAGLGVGLALAFVCTRAFHTLLYGVAATDPLTFAAAGAVLWAVSMMASSIPALRAARLDPALVLKDE